MRAHLTVLSIAISISAFAQTQSAPLELKDSVPKIVFTVQTVQGTHAVVDDEKNNTKVGEILYGTTQAVAARVTLVRNSMAAVEIIGMGSLQIGDTLTSNPNPSIKKRVDAGLMLADAITQEQHTQVPTPSATPEQSPALKEADSAISNSVGSLHYFVPKNIFYAETSGSFSLSDKMNIKTVSGSPLETIDTSSISMAVLLAYGITDTVTVGILEDIAIKNEALYQAEGSSTTPKLNREGPSNPYFGARYRYLISEPDGFTGDLQLAVAPSMLKNKFPEGTSSGTNPHNGATEVSGGTKLVWSRGPHEFSSSITLQYISTKKIENSAGSVDVDSIFAAKFGFAYRFQANPHFYIQPEIALTTAYDDVERTQSGSSATIRINIPAHVTWGGQLGFKVTDKIVLFSEILAYSFEADGSVTAAGTTLKGRGDISQTKLNFGINLAF